MVSCFFISSPDSTVFHIADQLKIINTSSYGFQTLKWNDDDGKLQIRRNVKFPFYYLKIIP